MQKCKTASWRTGSSNEQRDYVSLNGQKNMLLLDRIFYRSKSAEVLEKHKYRNKDRIWQQCLRRSQNAEI